jgi:apolipoprotein D and lipocalin family protein
MNFNLERYLGTWYEIAKIPFKWEIGCTFAKANYSWDSVNNVMLVRNDCLDENRNLKYSRSGYAYIENVNDMSKLRIKFNDGLPADPEGYYWVLYTDYDNYAIVSGGPVEKNYLWILSRTPTIPKEDARWLLNKVETFGYNPNKLLTNPKLLK